MNELGLLESFDSNKYKETLKLIQNEDVYKNEMTEINKEITASLR